MKRLTIKVLTVVLKLLISEILQSFEDKLKLWPFHALGFFSRVVSNLGIKVTYLLEAVKYNLIEKYNY